MTSSSDYQAELTRRGPSLWFILGVSLSFSLVNQSNNKIHDLRSI
jgi:hypothetical protein